MKIIICAEIRTVVVQHTWHARVCTAYCRTKGCVNYMNKIYFLHTRTHSREFLSTFAHNFWLTSRPANQRASTTFVMLASALCKCMSQKHGIYLGWSMFVLNVEAYTSAPHEFSAHFRFRWICCGIKLPFVGHLLPFKHIYFEQNYFPLIWLTIAKNSFIVA